MLDAAACFKDFKVAHLETIVRQAADVGFCAALAQMGSGEPVTAPTVNAVLERLVVKSANGNTTPQLYVAATNAAVDKYNTARLEELQGASKTYRAEDSGSDMSRLDATKLPSEITLKVGAQAMVTDNLDVPAGIVNGTFVLVTELGEGFVSVKVLSSGQALRVEPITREVKVWPSEAVVGNRRQLPLRVAYAVTFHKLQSLTMRVPYHGDFSEWHHWDATTKRAFVYVTLSRAADAKLVSLYLPGARKWSKSALGKILDPGQEARKALTAKLREMSMISNV